MHACIRVTGWTAGLLYVLSGCAFLFSWDFHNFLTLRASSVTHAHGPSNAVPAKD